MDSAVPVLVGTRKWLPKRPPETNNYGYECQRTEITTIPSLAPPFGPPDHRFGNMSAWGSVVTQPANLI